MVVMSEPKKRGYASRLRRENAEATRRRIIAAASELMVGQGYANTTMAAVAERAGVAVQTLYSSCPGGKPGLAKMVYDTALAGDAQAVPQSSRPGVQAILDEPDVVRKLARYSAMATSIQERVRSVHRVLHAAAASAQDHGLEAVVSDIERERLVGSRGPAMHLQSLGALRPGLTAERAAEQIYALTSFEVFERLTDICGWSAGDYEDWLTRLLVSALLDPKAVRPGPASGDGR
jgi:AcrR family transcriptional regulator